MYVSKLLLFLVNVVCTELKRGRMLYHQKVLLVLVCEMHFWVSCFLYSLDICCLPFLQGALLSLGIKVTLTKTCFYFKLCSFLTTDPCSFLHMVQMLLPILPLLSSVFQTHQTKYSCNIFRHLGSERL